MFNELTIRLYTKHDYVIQDTDRTPRTHKETLAGYCKLLSWLDPFQQPLISGDFGRGLFRMVDLIRRDQLARKLRHGTPLLGWLLCSSTRKVE